MGRRTRDPQPARHDWRPIRWPADVAAEVREPRSCPLPVRIVELSISGCRVWAGFRLRTGGPAIVQVAGLAALAGRIVWARDWQASIAFDAPLHPAVVRHIVGLSGDARGQPPSPFDTGTLGHGAGLG